MSSLVGPEVEQATNRSPPKRTDHWLGRANAVLALLPTNKLSRCTHLARSLHCQLAQPTCAVAWESKASEFLCESRSAKALRARNSADDIDLLLTRAHCATVLLVRVCSRIFAFHLVASECCRVVDSSASACIQRVSNSLTCCKPRISHISVVRNVRLRANSSRMQLQTNLFAKFKTQHASCAVR